MNAVALCVDDIPQFDVGRSKFKNTLAGEGIFLTKYQTSIGVGSCLLSDSLQDEEEVQDEEESRKFIKEVRIMKQLNTRT